MADYDTHKKAVDNLAQRLKETGKMSSEQAQKEAAKVARLTDSQQKGK